MHHARNRLFCLFCLLSLLLLAGCTSPPTNAEAARLNAFVTRWDDIREHRRAARMAFAKNDMPTAVVENLGWKPQQVAVEFIRQDTGKVIFQSAFQIGRNEIKYTKPPDPLTAGSYNLKVTPENSAPIVQNFSVYGY